MENLKYNIPRILIIVFCLLQLGISEVYINAINVLFVREVGFHLFLHIFLGLLASFTLIRANEPSKNNIFVTIIPVLSTVAAGYYTSWLIWSDYQMNMTRLDWNTLNLAFILIVGITTVVLIAYLIYVVVSIQVLRNQGSEKIVQA
jgi:hypothetical protein